ncbi:hypothetical protein [Pseudarthrobacter sp. SSS035]|uniref:hypothetical protein n=1 Tax=Pseudarthrobacter sp. SSS035 TaxID=2931399 RepID=UPI00200DEAC8|nr:hypothetical protein [Pseudarthrobacter sp. SSS035]
MRIEELQLFDVAHGRGGELAGVMPALPGRHAPGKAVEERHPQRRQDPVGDAVREVHPENNSQ